MQGNPIINKRIDHFEKFKKDLAEMNEKESKGEFIRVNETIERLQRWNRELERKKRIKSMKKPMEEMRIGIDNFQKSIVGVMKVTNGVTETLERVFQAKAGN